MDRAEAYNLLTEELKKLDQLRPDQLTALCENGIKIDRHGAGGALYSVELHVERKTGKCFVIAGRAHDNSGYRFSLLEERLVKNFAKEPSSSNF
jgi:hypothetical protein